MSFKFGDTVEIIAKPDLEEWWSGKVGEAVGYFPKAYVRLNPPTQHNIKKPDSVAISQMQETLFPNGDTGPVKSVKQHELDKKRTAILAAQGHRESPIKRTTEEDVTDEKQLADVKKQEQRRKLKESMLARQQQRRKSKRDAADDE